MLRTRDVASHQKSGDTCGRLRGQRIGRIRRTTRTELRNLSPTKGFVDELVTGEHGPHHHAAGAGDGGAELANLLVERQQSRGGRIGGLGELHRRTSTTRNA